MIITHKLKIDLLRKEINSPVSVVQGDYYTREVSIALYCGGAPWKLPDGHDIAIRYSKPDGTTGIYDTLPDGSAAWSSKDNTVTVTLCPQMLTCPGKVYAQVAIIMDDQILSTFPFVVDVAADPSKGAEKSETYNNWRKAFLPQTSGAQVGQYLQIAEVDADGRIVKVVPVDNPAGTVASNAAEALRISQEVAQEMHAYSPSGTRSIAEAAMRMAAQRIIAPEQAAVGQYFRVKEIDENGKITAVEAVDAPAGGGSGVYVGDEDGAVLAEIFINPDDPPTDYIPAPLAATVGQTMVVEEVNENGVPTKWRVSDLPTVPNALPNPHPLTIGDQTYDGSVPVSLDLLPGGGGNTGIFRQSVTVEEKVRAFTVNLPATWDKILLFNIHITLGIIEKGFSLYSNVGAKYTNLGDVPVGNDVGVNIYGILYHGQYFAAAFNTNGNSSYAAYPGGSQKAVGVVNDRTTITFSSVTDGVDIPAGTIIEIWGLYSI